jgi:hypothetical protein
LRSAIALSLSLAGALAAPAHAKITDMTVERVEDFAGGAGFGEAGAYERISGRAKGELDPKSPLNRGIVDLAKAPLNARDMVEYETEFFLLRPKDPAKASHTLVYEVNNRGNKYLIHQFDRVSLAKGINNDPKTIEEAGDGLLFRRGYTLAWSGWDPDVPRNNHQISIAVPVATDHGRPIVREIRDEFVPGNRGVGEEVFQLSHEAADTDATKASLTVRRKEAYPPETIPAARWAFVDARHIRLLPDGTKAEKGAIYDFHYRAQNPKVTGIGFAATRDFVAALRDPLQSDTVSLRVSRTRSRSASRKAAGSCATSSGKDSTARNRVAKSSTRSSPTLPAPARCSSIPNSPSPSAPARSMKTISCRRTPFPFRKRACTIP